MPKGKSSVGQAAPVPRKGQVYRRIGDGFVFRVENASRVARGAHMQCVDATMIFGWFDAESIALSFERIS